MCMLTKLIRISDLNLAIGDVSSTLCRHLDVLNFTVNLPQLPN